MTAELDAVKRASARRRRLDLVYRAALTAAYAAGYSYVEIARAAGVSRQAVRQWFTDNERKVK